MARLRLSPTFNQNGGRVSVVTAMMVQREVRYFVAIELS